VSVPRAIILMYHRLADAPPDPEEGDYVLPADAFAAHLGHLAAERRAVVTLAALADGSYPDRAVALTFDDGCESDATVAGPRLRALDFPAAFFVNPARVGQPGRASWPQLRQLAAEGFLIGSHGLDHTLFDGLPEAELRRQIAGSKEWLERELAMPVWALSLPGGSGDSRTLAVAREAGYRLVLGSRPGALRGPATAARVAPRVAVRREPDLRSFRATIDQRPAHLLRKALRYQAAHAGRRLMGAEAYGRLRMRWLGRRTGDPDE
jgi:peptidoglycan/xylan/chitin deacetylase (PgdA/CDA1 family)